MSFVRKDSYSDDVINDVKALIKAADKINRPIVVVPSVDCIICYYSGLPFAYISENGWEQYSDSYEKYISLQYDNYKETLLDSDDNWDNLRTVLDGIEKGLPNDYERHTEQMIVLNNSSFDKEKYSVCGIEAKVTDIDDGAPEVDMIVFCPNEKRMLIVEYKCKYGTLYPSRGHGIREHGDDYAKILKNDKSINFTKEMIKAYNVLCKIHDKEIINIDVDEVQLDIVFLLTGNTIRDVERGTEGNITLRANKGAMKVMREYRGKNFTDEIKDKVYWMWNEDFNEVLFNRDNLERLFGK